MAAATPSKASLFIDQSSQIHAHTKPSRARQEAQLALREFLRSVTASQRARSIAVRYRAATVRESVPLLISSHSLPVTAR
jgi:hypothetical protein